MFIIAPNSKEELISQLKTALPLPDYMGTNFDALEECLFDNDVVVDIAYQPSPAFANSPDGKVALKILTQQFLNINVFIHSKIVSELDNQRTDEELFAAFYNRVAKQTDRISFNPTLNQYSLKCFVEMSTVLFNQQGQFRMLGFEENPDYQTELNGFPVL